MGELLCAMVLISLQEPFDVLPDKGAGKKIPNDQRTTTPFLTKYERARILGARALQIRSSTFFSGFLYIFLFQHVGTVDD